MKKVFFLKNVQFIVNGDTVEIQVGDNWGNKIETNIETARKIYKAVRNNQINSAEHGLETFKAVNQIKDIINS